MSAEIKLYEQLSSLLGKNEAVELQGDGGKTYIVSQTSKGAIVVEGGDQQNIVLQNGDQIVVKSS
jgi:hypothetical protein